MIIHGYVIDIEAGDSPQASDSNTRFGILKSCIQSADRDAIKKCRSNSFVSTHNLQIPLEMQCNILVITWSSKKHYLLCTIYD